MRDFLIICRSFSSPQIVGALDACPGVSAWVVTWPGAIIAKATPATTVAMINAHLHARCPQEQFMAMEFQLDATAKGWMDPKVWDFIQASDPAAESVAV
jgi:hypothetical protein